MLKFFLCILVVAKCAALNYSALIEIKQLILDSRVHTESLIHESELRMERRIDDAELRMERRIDDAEHRMMQQMERNLEDLKFFMQNELQFSKLLVQAGIPCVGKIGESTIFGIHFNNFIYIVGPAHVACPVPCLKHPHHADVMLLQVSHMPIESQQNLKYFNLTIAYPTLGDSLVAIGFFGPSLRIWKGTVLSVERSSSIISTDGSNVGVVTMLTGGIAVEGMSGAPVFNSCGLAGISVGQSLRYQKQGNITFTYASGVQVVHVQHLLELLHLPQAKEYGAPFDPMTMKTCPTLTKSYCNL